MILMFLFLHQSLMFRPPILDVSSDNICFKINCQETVLSVLCCSPWCLVEGPRMLATRGPPDLLLCPTIKV